ncbi:antitoxin Xre/MbcA/ParS toxin-binding domain-containing protein [Sphingomonas sp. TDK1]|uniref:antitoxin Xre/MbcA/ParS toxin-binding domain-containing protein n=1 Tax=Sphingomonas sp. TDK1 TaxID=453247 RepID=UPI000A9A4ACD|nr:antitoxin Xre/MbcA/ParS toxin-binding domain-containing protein [Sphingomonas sp. TDK1]
MPDPTTTETTATRAPIRKQFRSKFGMPRPSPDSLERQSRVALLAWNLLGGDAAVRFLNSHDEALGGRPLDLAVASPVGCEAVEQAINARAERR